MKKFFEDFKKFITRGSIIDLAVGVVIGSAFSAIITALVNKILMPIITMVVPNGLDGLVTVLPGEGTKIAETTETQIVQYWGVWYEYANVINWGAFISAIINFLIIAFVLFVIIKIVAGLEAKRKEIEEKLKKKEPEPEPEPEPAPAPAPDIVLLTEIRDLLKTQASEKEVEKK